MHAMMKDTDCPMTLWGEAVCTAAYCLNRTPTSANGGITPFQAFEGVIPDISHMKMFYSDAYIHCSKSDGAKKLGDRACLVKFVGYPDGVNGYKFYDPLTHTITLSHSACILETVTHPPDDTAVNSFDDDNVSVTSDFDQHVHPPSQMPSPSPSATPSLPTSSPISSPIPSPTPSPPLPPEPVTRQLRDRSRIHPPSHLEPTDFGAHG